MWGIWFQSSFNKSLIDRYWGLIIFIFIIARAAYNEGSIMWAITILPPFHSAILEVVWVVPFHGWRFWHSEGRSDFPRQQHQFVAQLSEGLSDARLVPCICRWAKQSGAPSLGATWLTPTTNWLRDNGGLWAQEAGPVTAAEREQGMGVTDTRERVGGKTQGEKMNIQKDLGI